MLLYLVMWCLVMTSSKINFDGRVTMKSWCMYNNLEKSVKEFKKYLCYSLYYCVIILFLQEFLIVCTVIFTEHNVDILP